MYIKDSSFYDEFRDTTKANLYLLRPAYKSLSLSVISGTGFLIGDDVRWLGENVLEFPSGIFERDTPLLYSSGNEAIEFEAMWLPDDYHDPSLSSVETDAYIMVVYSVDENGKVLAPPGVDRVTLLPTYTTNTGIIWSIDFKIPASEMGFSIESMHLCYAVPVDPADISSIGHKEKNDIILSSIPYRNLEVELFDVYRSYANFIEKAGKKLRVLLQYQYNDIHSESFVYYYGEDPKYDKSTAVPKTTVKFHGLMDVLNSMTYVTTSSRYTTPVDKEINAYLMEIAEGFRRNLIPINANNLPEAAYNADFETDYGGDFLKLMLYAGYGKRGVVKDGELIMENYNHRTQTPADGYTFADAIRLLVNAKCHLVRVKNETLSAGAPQYILRNSGAVFTSEEYYSVPQKEVFKGIDKVKSSTEAWSAGDGQESHHFTFAFKDGGEGFYIGEKLWVAIRMEFGKPLVDLEKIWPSGDPFSVLDDCAYFTASGALTAMWDQTVHGNRGYVDVIVTGTPLEKTKESVYEKHFGSGKEVLELCNPFLRPRDEGYHYDIPDEYIDFNYQYQSGKMIYTLETRGRFDVHPLDRIQFIDDNGDLRSGIVIEHNMNFNGAMRSTFRVVDDGPAPNLYASNSVFNSKTLLCRKEV